MASWMALASFILLVITVLVLIACLVILIILVTSPSTTIGGVSNAWPQAVRGWLAGRSALNALTTGTNVVRGGPPLSAAGSGRVSMYGPGTDGSVEFVNRKTLRLTKDAFYRDLRLDGSALDTNGFRLFVAGTLTLLNESVIRNAGQDGAANQAASRAQALAPGGAAGGGGTLGGGGRGGDGVHKTLAAPAPDDPAQPRKPHRSDGGCCRNVPPGGERGAHAGQGGAVSAAVEPFGAGEGGAVQGDALRAMVDLAAALDPAAAPFSAGLVSTGDAAHEELRAAQWLGGGSGGGGGQGAGESPGSGGGGGGGVVLIVARHLQVGERGGLIDVGGGNAGEVSAEGPSTATSGGGGGGGLFVLATPSPPEDYRELRVRVQGGLSLDALGKQRRAGAGRALNWFRPEEPLRAEETHGGR
jgi:hypothetical protein